jgi:hypothetical protein
VDLLRIGREAGLGLAAFTVVPLALALMGFWLTLQQHIRHQRIENQRAASEQAMEERRIEQATLQSYLDQMGMLLRRSRPTQRE